MNELVIFDLDNTLIKKQSQGLLLTYTLKKGTIGLFFYFTIMIWFIFYKLGLVKNPRKIMEYSFSFLKGKNVIDFREDIDDFFRERLKPIIFVDVLRLINTHKAKGRKILIISNAIEYIPKKISEFLNIDYYIGTKLEIKNNKFTGMIDGDIIYGKNKVFAIKEFVKENNLFLKNSWGYSDHHSDIPFLKTVDFPIVVNPTKKLLKEAQKRKWPILKFKK